MPSKDDLDIECSVMDALNFTARSHHHSVMPAWDNSSLSSCATTVIGDDRIVDVSSCSISIVSSSSRMSVTGGSRSPSEINHRADEKEKLRVEEKLKLCRERQEEDRQRRLQEIEVSSQQRQKYREQMEEERRRKIDELKAKEFEKRNAVEERKRFLWKADQERKEAILRRNNEIHEKLDAKRLALRNNSGFVFGSSTPRTMNLDVAVLGPTSRHNNNLLIISSAAQNKSVADEFSSNNLRRRPISAFFSDEHLSTLNTKSEIALPENTGKVNNRGNNSSNQTRIVCSAIDNSNAVQPQPKPLNGAIVSVDDDKLMSQSLVCLTGISRGRKRHTELRPVMPRETALTSPTTRINKNNANSDTREKQRTKRAVSMSRLDQLSKPRRIYLEESLKAQNSCNVAKQQPTNDKNLKAKSMCNLANSHKSNKKTISSATQHQNAAVIRNNAFATKSMTKLNSDEEKSKTSANHRFNNRSKSANKSQQSECRLRRETTTIVREKSKSMIQLSSKAAPTAKPRQTRASKLREQSSTLRNSKSSVALNDPHSNPKENKSSTPVRPISSLTLHSSHKDNESDKVKLKPDSSRKPRPVSIGTTFRIKKISDETDIATNRESRSTERKAHTSPTNSTPLANRARSAGESLNKLSIDKNAKTLPSKSPKYTNNKKLVAENNKKSDTQVMPIIEPKPMERHISVSLDNFNNSANFSPKKQQMSEIEYKKLMIEKRKQVKKQQIERDAEIERKRQESEKLEELEKQKTIDDEMTRLEKERMREVMDEKKRVDDTKNKQRKEELRDKEEKERKAKQESEHKRLELEQRLKKDEEERLARKKKLEAIMSRTRKTLNPKKLDQQSNDRNGVEKTREEANNYQNMLKTEQLVIISNNDINKPDIVEAHRQLNAKENGDSLTNSSSDGSLESANLINYYQFSSASIDTPDQSIDNSYEQLIELNYNSPNSGQDVNSKQCSPIIIATSLKNSLKIDDKSALINGI